MARPPKNVRLGHESTRERILAAARDVLRAQGASGLGLREVARVAGLSPASLYEHFDGLSALVDALATEAAAKLRLALERAVEPRCTGDPLVSLGLAYVLHAKNDPEGFHLLFAQGRSARTSTKAPLPSSSPFAVVVREVERGVADGRIRVRAGLPAEHVAYGLWATAHGMATLQLTHLAGFDADFDAADRALLEAFVRGLR